MNHLGKCDQHDKIDYSRRTRLTRLSALLEAKL